jgi:hypothetical protein
VADLLASECQLSSAYLVTQVLEQYWNFITS